MADSGSITFNINDISKSEFEQKPRFQHKELLIDNKIISGHADEINTAFPDDTSVIFGFWGTDPDRISASVAAITHILKTVDPSKCIFIEAQKTRSITVFGWLLSVGVKYKFIKLPKESEGIFIKMPLWNIGTTMTDAEKLIFLDTDVYFEENDWLLRSSAALDKYDVISPAGWNKYGNSDKAETIGNQIMNTGTFSFCHGGFALGMTRKAYMVYGGFDAVNYLDDQWFWFKLIGKQPGFEKLFILPYRPIEKYYGYPISIGSAECNCIHINHDAISNIRYQYAHDISYEHCDFPMQDIIYDKNNTDILPKWNTECKIGNIMKKCFKLLFSNKANEYTYFEQFKTEFGEIDDNHQLVIVTIYKPDYLHKTIDCVIRHKKMFDDHCKNYFIYVCFSNHKIDGIDTIPYDEKNYEKNINSILNNKKVVYPKNSVIFYSNIDDKIDQNFNVCYNIEKKFLTKNDLFFINN